MNTGSSRLIERKEIVPKCPHCDQLLNEIFFQRISEPKRLTSQLKAIFFCPSCSKLLGVSSHLHTLFS